jgi:hypothetical protein
VAGSWFVVCSGTGGKAGVIGREGNRAARADKMFFQRARKSAGEAGTKEMARGPEKDLGCPERAQREPGCAPGRACETDKPGYTADPATGNLTGTATAWTQPPGQQPPA